MKHALKKLVLVAALVAPLAPITPSGTPVAQAADAGGGTVNFEGTAHLPTFPCPPPQPGDFPCNGVFNGIAVGALSGVHGPNNIPWAVEMSIGVKLNGTTPQITPKELARFSYFDEIEPGAPCMEGMAKATGRLTGGIGEVFGAYGGNLPTPLPVTGVDIAFSFDWRRIGTAAVMEFITTKVDLIVTGINGLPTRITVVDAGPGGTVSGSRPGWGAAAFVPDPVQFRDRMPACEGAAGDPAARGPLSATVTGTAQFAIAEQS